MSPSGNMSAFSLAATQPAAQACLASSWLSYSDQPSKTVPGPRGPLSFTGTDGASVFTGIIIPCGGGAGGAGGGRGGAGGERGGAGGKQ